MLIPRPPASKQMNIARGRRFSMIGRSAPSSFGFRAAVNASPKNAAFTGSVALAGHPPIGMDAPLSSA
jgi:hypothetical protein